MFSTSQLISSVLQAAVLSFVTLLSTNSSAIQEGKIEQDVTQLLNWAVHLSRYDKPDSSPDVKFVTHDYLVLNACYGKDCDVLGWYNDQKTIYIDRRIAALDTLMERSVMVHEMVHFLQDISGQYQDDCAAQVMREREAYEIQRQYFYAYGALSPVRAHHMQCRDPLLADSGD